MWTWYHSYAWTIKKPYLPKNRPIDVMQSHPLHRTCFGQYQASSAVLRWLGDGLKALSCSYPSCSYLSGSCPLFEGRSDYTRHVACVQVYRSGGDTGMHMYSYKYPLSHHTWRSVSSRDCLIRTFSTCGREEHVHSPQTWPNYRSLSEKYTKLFTIIPPK